MLKPHVQGKERPKVVYTRGGCTKEVFFVPNTLVETSSCCLIPSRSSEAHMLCPGPDLMHGELCSQVYYSSSVDASYSPHTSKSLHTPLFSSLVNGLIDWSIFLLGIDVQRLIQNNAVISASMETGRGNTGKQAKRYGGSYRTWLFACETT